ncbi:MAG: hypothetical protein FJ293_14240, partial [Planctomycetes bacterium]|nr:hypothetical protein [Planctomycetota bacterium]
MPDEPPRARWRVAGAPLDPAVRTRLRLDAVWPWPDAAVACGRNVGREVRRIEGAPPLLVKAFVRGHAGTARREARMVELAAAAGLLVPRRVAELVRDDGARALVLAPVAG